MEVLYISTMCDDDLFADISQKCRGAKPTIAGIRFDRNIAFGLAEHCDVQALSYLPIGSYPNYPGIFWSHKACSLGGVRTKYASFINLPIIKQLCLMTRIARAIVSFADKKRGSADRAIVLSCVNPEFVIPAVFMGAICGVRVFGIVADLAEFSIAYRSDVNPLKKMLSRITGGILNRLRANLHGYVFLSKYMSDLVNPHGKPSIVVEGMIEEDVFSDVPDARREKAVMYAGGLNVKYGIDKLVRAFQMADTKDYELWIFGSGDYEQELKAIEARDKRIRFFGTVSHKQVLEYERKAALLVNPRPSDEEFTKYSFPSKIIEYMASGTPVLVTPLPCIPEDYIPYLHLFADETIAGMANELSKILAAPPAELLEKGRLARDYILSHKTSDIQCGKIAEFIEAQAVVYTDSSEPVEIETL